MIDEDKRKYRKHVRKHFVILLFIFHFPRFGYFFLLSSLSLSYYNWGYFIPSAFHFIVQVRGMQAINIANKLSIRLNKKYECFILYFIISSCQFQLQTKAYFSQLELRNAALQMACFHLNKEFHER